MWSGVAHSQRLTPTGEVENIPATELIDLDFFQSLLQKFSDEVYGQGFRHLGDENDFDHGHILYSTALRPVAILYHTQETASLQHRLDPGGPYDYINRGARNWLQFFDVEKLQAGPIVNAFFNMLKVFPNAAIFRSDLKSTKSHNTIFPHQLDGESFPLEYRYRLRGQRQIEFARSSCELSAEDRLDTSTVAGVLRVHAAGTEHCLKVTAPVTYLPFEYVGEWTLQNDYILPQGGERRNDQLHAAK